MGIRHLNTFMFKFLPNGVEQIDIKREIEQHRRKYNVSKPVVIIDLSSIQNIIFKNSKENLFGGRFDHLNKRVEEIFQKLTNLGITLVCIKDGILFEDKIETVINRRNRKYNDHWNILKDMENNFKTSDLKLEDLTPYFYNLKLIVKKYCEIIVSSREGDQEIVYQANKQNALAIISHDTDFLIFNGSWQFWIGPNLNIDNLSIKRFNKSALRSYLALSPSQMILFATICGNDFVQYDMVEAFHRRISRIQNKFEKIAAIVRKIPSLPPKLNYYDEKYLIELMFKPEHINKGLQDFKRSMDFYCNVTEPAIHPSLLLKHVSSISSFIYSILSDIPFNLNLFYFDLTKTDLMPYYQLIKPIIQRQMGIIFKSAGRNNEDIRRAFIVKLTHSESYKKILEIPKFPNEDIPSLEQFILVPFEKYDLFYQKRLQLFCWHVFPEDECSYFTPDLLSKLPNELVVTITIITFLVEKKQITVEEADCLLFACIFNYQQKDRIQINQFNYISNRDARVAFLFLRLISIIENSLELLGLQNFLSVILFDGLYYHYLRQNYQKEQSLIPNLISEFCKFRIYVRHV